MRFLCQIRHQLEDSEELIGYLLDEKVLNRYFLTLLVLENKVFLKRCVQLNPHGRVMTDLLPDMGQTEFLPFKVNGSSIPPDWKDTKRRMRER